MDSPEFGIEIRGSSTSASSEQMAALKCGAKPKDENMTAKSEKADVWTDPEPWRYSRVFPGQEKQEIKRVRHDVGTLPV